MPLRRMAIACDCRSTTRSVSTLVDLHVLSVSNHGVPLTGALVQTPTHSAAIIEGAPASIKALWSLVERDCPTYRRLRVVHISRRRIAGWSRPFVGDALYVQRSIDNLMHDANDAAVDQFEQLIVELAKVGGLAV